MKKLRVWTWLLPSCILLSIFYLYPLVQSFYTSLCSWSGLDTQKNYVGLSNYIKLLRDPYFSNAMKNTLIYNIVFGALSLFLGLIFAVAIDAKIKCERVFFGIIYSPYVFSFVAVALMWSFVYRPDIGIINTVLNEVGLGSFSRAWLADPKTALISIAIAASWRTTGFCMVTFISGLRSIPVEITEAAKVDGASSWKQFYYVTLPMLKSSFVVVITMLIIWSVRAFDLIYIMTHGGPYYASEVLATMMYRETFQNFHMGYGSSIAIMMFFITIITCSTYLKKMAKGGE